MTETVHTNNKRLIVFQRAAWLGCVAYFALVTILLILKMPVAHKLSQWGIIAILAAGIVQLFVMAAEFKRVGNKKFALLSYILMVVIVTTATVGAFFL